MFYILYDVFDDIFLNYSWVSVKSLIIFIFLLIPPCASLVLVKYISHFIQVIIMINHINITLKKKKKSY